jgi:hypothetical protein
MTFEEADRRYPYDPLARAPMLRGLEKLRAFEDPEWRRMVFQAMGGRETPADESDRRHP